MYQDLYCRASKDTVIVHQGHEKFLLSLPSNVVAVQILGKLESLTLYDMLYNWLPAPKMLGCLTHFSIPAGASSFFQGATSE